MIIIIYQKYIIYKKIYIIGFYLSFSFFFFQPNNHQEKSFSFFYKSNTKQRKIYFSPKFFFIEIFFSLFYVEPNGP